MKCPLNEAELKELAELAAGGATGAHRRGTKKYRFDQLGKKVLRALVRDIADGGSWEIKFNPGGVAVTGESTLVGPGLFAQVGWDTGHGILYRRATKDDRYGARSTNRWWPIAKLSDWEAFIAAVRNEIAVYPE